MAEKMKIGIVGCGAIGASLAEGIVKDFKDEAELYAIYDIDRNRSFALAEKLKNEKLAVLNLKDLIALSDLVIESASAGVSYEIACRAINLKRHVLVMSVAGIWRRFFELKKMAQKKKVNLLVPSGAISGLDGLKASSLDKIKEVVLTTKKPPSAFINVPYVLRKKINLCQTKNEILLFKGKVDEAVKFFPQNINICATLALLCDADKIKVNIIASGALKKNTHELLIVSQAGRIFIRCENTIHPRNPKTSYLAVLSALAALRGFLQNAKIGT